jgi:hypothetical protein
MCDYKGSLNSATALEDAPPVCWHIRPFVSYCLAGAFRGFLGWFLQEHISRCRNCQKALAQLQIIGEQLRNLGKTPPERTPETLGQERWDTLESALAEADSRHQRRRK